MNQQLNKITLQTKENDELVQQVRDVNNKIITQQGRVPDPKQDVCPFKKFIYK